MNQPSPLSVIDPRAIIADDVEIGPFCVIGPEVQIGPGCKLENNVTLTGRVTPGCDNHLFPGAVIGAPPQDLRYRGSDTQAIIGIGTVIREAVTVNRATEKEDGITSIGDGCYLMACSHVAHDCRLADRVIMANSALLGGHVHIASDATLSGNVAVHHYASIGEFAFVAGGSTVRTDVPPYMLVEGATARPRCVNIVALKRNNFANSVMAALMEAQRLLFRSKVGLDHAREILRGNQQLFPQVVHLLTFIETQQEGRHGRARERRRAA